MSDERDPTIGIPMVCFCDIPLSQTIDHMQTYGNYALGLTKDWGMRSSVAPVIYSHPAAGTATAILDLYERADPDPPGGRSAPVTIADFHSERERLVCFLKPYAGLFHRRGKPARHVKFYDEREWRYVPTGIWSAIDRATYTDFRLRREANDRLAELPPLSFEPSDIRYVVVSDENEILPMIGEIQRIKDKYSWPDIQLLCSRIVSATQIAADF